MNRSWIRARYGKSIPSLGISAVIYLFVYLAHITNYVCGPALSTQSSDPSCSCMAVHGAGVYKTKTTKTHLPTSPSICLLIKLES